MRTKSNANKPALLAVAGLWMLTILACSRSVQYQAPLATPIIVTSIPVLEETSQASGSGGLIGGGSGSLDAPTFLPPEEQPALETIDVSETTEVLPLESPTAELTTPELTASAENTETPAITETEAETQAPAEIQNEKPMIVYTTQSGDTLALLAKRFGVSEAEIVAPSEIHLEGMLMPDQILLIPDRLENTTSQEKILPDSSVVYSPAALNFYTDDYVKDAGGYLSEYKEWGKNGSRTGADTVQLLASENSINPMLLLTILEYQSQWVTASPATFVAMDYPVGYLNFDDKGLYNQLRWAIAQLSTGYYHWRSGDILNITLKDGTSMRLAPELNAGTVAIMYMYAQIMDKDQWENTLYGEQSILQKYESMFENPWEVAQQVEPLFSANLAQPPLELPFQAGHVWALTGGPHTAWDEGGAMAALDFAPSSMESGCIASDEWVTAVADGLVMRSDSGVVLLDLDGDAQEETGWVILYLHIANDGRIANGMWVKQGDAIGHPSCEGGKATGTHVHIARKYNGEWILADQQMPFVMSGWEAHAGDEPYLGTMTKGDQIVTASVNGSYNTHISR